MPHTLLFLFLYVFFFPVFPVFSILIPFQTLSIPQRSHIGTENHFSMHWGYASSSLSHPI
jgi:hypothetical protein